MKIYGLIGNPLSHSLSQKYFLEKFRRKQMTHCKYELFQLEDLTGLLPLIRQKSELSGLNVTIPFKERIIELLDYTDGLAKETGAVNCIRITRSSGRPYLLGYNTDVFGFEKAIKPGLQKHHTNALILGTGGGSRAVAYVFRKLGILFTKVSRHPKGEDEIEYASITPEMTAGCRVIVNTTPLGMIPDTESLPPIPYEFITSDHLLFDLIYNPEETLFLKHGKMRGAKVMNGLKMLHFQAEKSWEIWSG
jgi:shikimate dehydrogenase